MKIKALKTFVSGRFNAGRGEVLEVPDKTGQKLVSIGFAEVVKASEKTEAPAADKEPAAPKKKDSAGKSGAKASASK